MTSPASRVRRTSGAELVERADGRLAVRKTVYLSPRVENRLAAYAQGHQLAMSDVVEAALLAYLPAKTPAQSGAEVAGRGVGDARPGGQTDSTGYPPKGQ